eukprot:4959198-Pyramimonas_sp.AAC.1
MFAFLTKEVFNVVETEDHKATFEDKLRKILKWGSFALLQVLQTWRDHTALRLKFKPFIELTKKEAWKRSPAEVDLIAQHLKELNPFFANLWDVALKGYARILRIKEYKPRALLYAENHKIRKDSDVYFVVLHGEVNTLKVGQMLHAIPALLWFAAKSHGFLILEKLAPTINSMHIVSYVVAESQSLGSQRSRHIWNFRAPVVQNLGTAAKATRIIDALTSSVLFSKDLCKEPTVVFCTGIPNPYSYDYEKAEKYKVGACFGDRTKDDV